MFDVIAQVGIAYVAIGAVIGVVTFIAKRPQKTVPIYARVVWASGLGLTWPVALGIQLNALPYGLR